MPPKAGAKFIQTDLARTITYMADQERGALKHGRIAGLKAAWDAFYRGDIACEIAAFQQREGGYLSMDDLSGYRSEVERPIHGNGVAMKWPCVVRGVKDQR